MWICSSTGWAQSGQELGHCGVSPAPSTMPGILIGFRRPFMSHWAFLHYIRLWKHFFRQIKAVWEMLNLCIFYFSYCFFFFSVTRKGNQKPNKNPNRTRSWRKTEIWRTKKIWNWSGRNSEEKLGRQRRTRKEIPWRSELLLAALGSGLHCWKQQEPPSDPAAGQEFSLDWGWLKATSLLNASAWNSMEGQGCGTAGVRLSSPGLRPSFPLSS